ncbi:MAG: LysR family transcriptional regulator [Rickettsiales bacterium]|nr:LysR family transcriptional regulator [Rickettsiales bacterium]
MDWQKLYYFLAVARSGSLKAAAEQLGMNHSTIYRQLNDFEKALGFKLFNRHASGYTLTEQGQRMFRTASSIQEQVDGLEYYLSEGMIQLSGTIRLWIQPELLQHIVVFSLKLFQSKFPSIQFNITTSGPVPDVSSHPFDVVITASKHQFLEQNTHKLLDINYGYYASKHYVDQCGGLKALQSHDGHCIIQCNDQPLATKADLKGNSTLSCDTVFAQIALVEQGSGIGLLPNYVTFYQDHLIKIPSPNLKTHHETEGLWFIVHPEHHKSPRIDAFKGFVIEQIAKQKVKQRSFLNLVDQ